MTGNLLCPRRRASGRVVAVGVLSLAIAAAHSPLLAAETDGVPGRIDFDEGNLPAATVEVDLSEGMFGDLVGLGQAAVGGVAETLEQATGQGRGSDGTRLAAEQLAAAQQLLDLAKGVVREIRVRVYEDLSDEVATSERITLYDDQLRKGNWENIVRIRNDDAVVRVSLLRREGAILGAFVVVSDHGNLVLANIVGNVSPDNVKRLTSAAAKIGLDNGLQHVLDAKLQKFGRHRPPRSAPPALPTPPEPPVPSQPAQPSAPENGR